MYGLPHAGKIANDRLIKHLVEHGYVQAKHTHGLFTRESRKGLMFSLVIDDFGVYQSADAHHLASTLQNIYNITTNWTGSTYLSLTLDGDYKARTCDVLMPGYILARFSILPFLRQPKPNIPHMPGRNSTTAARKPNLLNLPTF